MGLEPLEIAVRNNFLSASCQEFLVFPVDVFLTAHNIFPDGFVSIPDGFWRSGISAALAGLTNIFSFFIFYFNRQADGVLGSLQAKHVLTGINLECLAAILQNKESHYDLYVYAAVLSDIYYVSFPCPLQVTF